MNAIVLDASALIAYFRQEPGSELVRQALAGAYVSTVNVCEVLSDAVERGAREQELWAALSEMSLTIVEFDIELARSAARMRLPTRAKGLSLADRACLALGKSLRAEVWTTDRVWSELSLGVSVRLIR